MDTNSTYYTPPEHDCTVMESYRCLLLARAVIEQAMQDATSKQNHDTAQTLMKDVDEARNFLLAADRAQRESLEAWCELANIPVENVISLAKKWRDSGWPQYKRSNKDE